VNRSILESLGLQIREVGSGLEADLPLVSGQLINPLTRQFLTQASFAVVGDKLLVIDPPELVGSPSVSVARVESSQDIETLLSHSLSEHVVQVQRRSAELTALGVQPNVHPRTLQLSATIKSGPMELTIASDRRGNFKVVEARRDGAALPEPSASAFELSEFRDRHGLEAYLAALFEAPQPAASTQAPVTFRELVDRFGPGALVPTGSPIEMLVEIRVQGQFYRFAAARMGGRTFRGLLAGTSGKLWAERFELDDFPGVAMLVSQVLHVPREAVELLGRPKG
jgi:hypothetical protein